MDCALSGVVTTVMPSLSTTLLQQIVGVANVIKRKEGLRRHHHSGDKELRLMAVLYQREVKSSGPLFVAEQECGT